MTTITVYRHFQQQYHIKMSSDIFVSLCACLHILLYWGFELPTSAFDLFIYAYDEFRVHASTSLRNPAYHDWLISNQLVNHRKGVVLDPDILESIGWENLYTFNFVKRAMEIITD